MMARPSATRWRWPPDNCDGLRSRRWRQADDIGDPLQPRIALGARNPAHPQAEDDVLGHVEMRKQRVGLEYHRDLALGRRQIGDICAADHHRAAVGLLQPCDQPQRGRLAATGGSEQDQQRALVGLKADPVHRTRRAPALDHAIEPDGGHGYRPAFAGGRPWALPLVPRAAARLDSPSWRPIRFARRTVAASPNPRHCQAC